jgi:hypothetical protein
MLEEKTVAALRAERQCLLRPAGEGAYDALFQWMSPVPTISWCEPGSPPTLPPHADFDDGLYNAGRRRQRQILKGRFGGRVAYVTREDWELFACLYQKPVPVLSESQRRMLELLRQEGPLNIGMIKEMTGLLVKQITPILHRLQEAFLVYEDQVENDWDRGWYLFEQEFPDVDLKRYTKTEALCRVLPRFAYLHGFFTAEMAKCFYRLPMRAVQAALEFLTAEGALVSVQLGGEAGYALPGDMALLQKGDVFPAPHAAMLLQRNDFLVRSLESGLKKRFSSPDELLYYLFIDGEIRGALCGRFRFGPHDLTDVLLELPEEERHSRRGEILAAIYTEFDPALSPLGRYCGEKL